MGKIISSLVINFPLDLGISVRSVERKCNCFSREPGAKSQEPGAKSQEPGARSQELKGLQGSQQETELEVHGVEQAFRPFELG
jgi:hypothetical protein